MNSNLSRRSFITITGVSGAAFLLPGCGMINRFAGIPHTKLPMIDDAWDLEDGTLTLDLGKLPEISELGGAVRIEGEPLQDSIFIVFGEDGNYYAFKNACTHGGRMLDPVAGTMTIECCSVSKSTFDYQGNVLSGPAKGPLTSYPLEVDGDRILITL